MKLYYKFIFLISLLFMVLIAVELSVPKPVDWKVNLSRGSSSPYGSYILFDVLKHIFPDKGVARLNHGIFITLPNEVSYPSNYIFICWDYNSDEHEMEKLKEYVRTGNNVFISATEYPDVIEKEFNFEVTTNIFPRSILAGLRTESDSIQINIVNPAYKLSEVPSLRSDEASYYFNKFDTAATTVLGNNSRGQVNFIKIPYEEGNFYLHTVPLVFTNYHLLQKNKAAYASLALSYLPVHDTFWDEYYKPGRRANRSELRFILNDESLRWAYILSVASLLFFAVFSAKRQQRVIPVIESEKNSTLEFIRTIGRLYFQQGNHTDLVRKKIIYFKDFLRNRFYLRQIEYNNDFYRLLAEKSGVPITKVIRIMSYVKTLEYSNYQTEDNLLTLNSMIEEFIDLTQKN